MKTFRNIYLVVLAILAIFLIASCEIESNLEGNGNVITQRRVVQPFDEIDIDGVLDVYLKQSELTRVEVVTDENLTQLVDIKSVNGVLYIDTEEDKEYDATQMDIYISTPKLTGLNLDGVTALYCENTLFLSDVEIEKNNTGLLDFKANLDKLKIISYGVGDIKLYGKSDQLEITNSMVGNIHAFDFITKSLTLNHDGTGDVEVYVLENLEVDITGVGDVYCKGSPKNITKLSENIVGRIYMID